MKLSPRHALVLGAMLAFSLMALFTRGADAPIVGIAAWRAVIVAAVFGVWALWAEGSAVVLNPDSTTRRLGLIYGLCLAVASATFVGGYAFTTVANTIFFHNLAPLAAFPLAWWAFQERPGAAVMTGGGIAMLGVALISGVSLFHLSHFTNPRFLLGDALSVVSALGYAGVLVMTRATRREGTPILTTLFVAWTVAAVVLVAVALGTGDLGIPARSILWVVGLALVCTNLPFYLLNLGMRDVSAGMASVLSLSEVVFATLLGLLVYGERLAPLGWIGGLLVAFGVLYPLVVSEDAEDAPRGSQQLAPETVRIRTGRLAVGLVLLNGGAVLVLAGGAAVGALLAWAGLLTLLRLGAQPVEDALGWKRPIQAVLAVGGLAALAGILSRGALLGLEGSLLGGGLALGAWYLDHLLVAAEPDRDRQVCPGASRALLAIGLGQCVAFVGHPAGGWLVLGGAALLALEALGLLQMAGSGRFFGATRLDSIGSWFSGRGRLLGLALVVFVLGGAVVVPPGHRGVVERLGFPLEEARAPGLAITLPPPIEQVVLVDVERVRRVRVAESDRPLLTGDQSMVSIGAVLHYRVEEAHAFAYGAQDPEQVLAGLARAALVRAVGTLTQDEVLTSGRRELEERVTVAAQTLATQAELGVEVLDTRLALVVPPPPVVSAFMDVISADEEKRSSIHLAEAYAARTVPIARGNSLALLEEAVGQAAALSSRADVEHSHLQALVVGGAISPALTRFRVGREMLEMTLSDARLVIAPHSIRLWLGNSIAEPVDPSKFGSNQ